MKTIFFLRHQAGGVIHEYPFAESPTPGQREPIETLMALRHGTTAQDGSTLWMIVVPVQVIEPGEVPEVKLPGIGKENVAGVGEVSVHAVGTVTNPPLKG